MTGARGSAAVGPWPRHGRVSHGAGTSHDSPRRTRRALRALGAATCGVGLHAAGIVRERPDRRSSGRPSGQTMAFISTRSMTPELVLGADRRSGAARRWQPAVRSISVDAPKKSAPMRSILLTKAMRGTLYLFACRQTVSDCGSTPPTRAEDRDGAVEHAQGALDLDREVHVAGRVDDVDAVVASRSRSWRRR